MSRWSICRCAVGQLSLIGRSVEDLSVGQLLVIGGLKWTKEQLLRKKLPSFFLKSCSFALAKSLFWHETHFCWVFLSKVWILGLFRTQANVSDIVFFAKIVNSFQLLTVFTNKPHHKAVNTSLAIVKPGSSYPKMFWKFVKF